MEVNKLKPGYANFSINQPPLKLVLFENKDADLRINHLGVETFQQQEVDEAVKRFSDANIIHGGYNKDKTCCHAKQDKVFSMEPQGILWEWYRVVADSEEFGCATI